MRARFEANEQYPRIEWDIKGEASNSKRGVLCGDPLAAELGNVDGTIGIDWGCRDAWFARGANRAGARKVWAVDESEAAIKRARELSVSYPDIAFATSLENIAPESVDWVASSMGLMLLPSLADLQKTVKAMSGCLVQGGRFRALVPYSGRRGLDQPDRGGLGRRWHNSERIFPILEGWPEGQFEPDPRLEGARYMSRVFAPDGTVTAEWEHTYFSLDTYEEVVAAGLTNVRTIPLYHTRRFVEDNGYSPELLEFPTLAIIAGEKA